MELVFFWLKGCAGQTWFYFCELSLHTISGLTSSHVFSTTKITITNGGIHENSWEGCDFPAHLKWTSFADKNRCTLYLRLYSVSDNKYKMVKQMENIWNIARETRPLWMNRKLRIFPELLMDSATEKLLLPALYGY